jgi:hypothetical protein
MQSSNISLATKPVETCPYVTEVHSKNKSSQNHQLDEIDITLSKHRFLPLTLEDKQTNITCNYIELHHNATESEKTSDVWLIQVGDILREDRLITNVLSIQANGWLHCKRGQNLKEMVLHDITDNALIVKVLENSHPTHQIYLTQNPLTAYYNPVINYQHQCCCTNLLDNT